VVPEHDPTIGRNEIAAVVEAFGRRGSRRVEREDLGGEECAIEAVTERIDAHSRHDEPHGVDALAAVECDGRQREGAECDDGGPEA
jgi:hypothetical protein